MKQTVDHYNAIDTDGTQSIFTLTVLEKIKEKGIKIFSRKCKSIIKDGKLSRSAIWTNRYTMKQIKICCQK